MASDRPLVRYLESIAYGKRRGVFAAVIRASLLLLSAVYRASLWLYLLPFRTGLRKRHRLGKPVISVGNITVGGTGKTPTVQYVCRTLMRLGYKPAVLSYGYGGSLNGRCAVVSDGSRLLMTERQAGDEPVMLARSLPGVPVIVGRHRHISGRIALDQFGVDAIVLDDGFQVWKLHRDVDIVLLSHDKPFDNFRTLPAGRLREPVSALKRADCVVVTGDGGVEVPEEVPALLPGKPTFRGRFAPSGIYPLSGGEKLDVETLRGKRVLALSGIANPAAFERTLSEIGAVVAASERFPDHHPYSDDDIRKINQRASEESVETIVTTEKDSVKLDGRSFVLPVLVLTISLSMDDEPSFERLILDKVGKR